MVKDCCDVKDAEPMCSDIYVEELVFEAILVLFFSNMFSMNVPKPKI